MSRELPNEVLTTIEQDVVYPVIAVELLFDTPNELRFWSGLGDLVIDGDTYAGSGDLLQVSDVQESSDISARGATLTLSGVPSNLVSLALDEDYQGRTASIKFGMYGTSIDNGYLILDDSGDKLLVDGVADFLDISNTAALGFFNLFVGKMDQMTIQRGPAVSEIVMSLESRLIDLERPRLRRYTDGGQQDRYPGDLAFEFVSRIQNEDLEFGV